MDTEESNDMGNSATAEPIEISVISMDTVQDMIIVQPDEMNQADTNSTVNIPLNNAAVELSNEANVTPSRKKRKITRSPKKTIPQLDDDDDDGSTCSICLDSWEHKGEHRLVSLKCGHLFGDSCIRRWIHESPANSKHCPTCKTKINTVKEIRPLYAKRIVVMDKSEEYRLTELLEKQKERNADLQSSLSAIKLELAVCKEEKTKLEMEYKKLRMFGTYHDTPHSSSRQNIMYKMSMHKNIDINREGGCRVMTYGRRIQTLILSQKTSNALFPGYGVRFVSAYNLQPTVNFRISAKSIRDLSLDTDEELLAAASQCPSAYIYSVTNNLQVAAITPSDASNASVWATSFDKNRPKHLHVGTQQGATYIYDARSFNEPIKHLTTPGDPTPVIAIESIPASNDFPCGGFVVCKLRSLWFYEYVGAEGIEQTKLTVDGSINSISYDTQTNVLLIAMRSNATYPQSRLILANITKIDQTTVLRTICTILGSQTSSVMSRSTQITMGNDSLVASYLQDTKTLGLWNASNGVKMPGFKVDDCLMDMCPIYLNNQSFLATLSETKCRIFQVNSV